MKLTKKDKRNLFIGIITVAVLGLITLFVMTNRANATGGWEHTDTTYSECVANDSEDCENSGGTKTKTKHYEKTIKVCPEGYTENQFSITPKDCNKGPIWNLQYANFIEKTLEKTEESTVDCEVIPPVCEEPEVPEVECTGNCGTPPTFAGSSTDAPAVCSAPLPPTPQNALVWRHGDSATVQWVPTPGVDKAIIYWKENSSNDWQHAMVTSNSGYETVGALSDMDITFGVSQYNGCSQSEIVVIVDGSGEGVMFTPES